MARFISRIILASGLTLAALAFALAVRIFIWQGRMNEVYSLPEGIQYVFIGNSHIGSNFVEDPCWSNRVIYTNSSHMLAFLWRLSELERRGGLAKLKAVVFNYDTFGIATSHSSVREDALREVACMWRNFEVIPDKFKVDAIAPLFWAWHLWTVGDAQTTTNKRYVDRSPEEKRQMLLAQNAADFVFAKFAGETEFLLRQAKAICDRHNIKLVLVATPLVEEHKHQKNAKSDCLSEAAALARALGCKFYDYRSAFSDEDFFDTNHLTNEAARRFTERFYHDVLWSGDLND